MDDETADSAPESSVNTTVVVTKPRKKVPGKKVADKDADPVKKRAKVASAKKTKTEQEVKKTDKAAISTKKANKTEAVKADKVKPSKTGKETEEPAKDNKSILELVCEAIEVLGESRKGLSAQAIKKYVKSKKDSAATNLDTLINKALTKGIEGGTLIRPNASKDVKGAVGYFRLAKVQTQKRTIKTTKRQKIDSEHASDSEAIEKPTKPRKRNLSDSYFLDMKGSLKSTPKPSTKPAANPKDSEEDLKSKKSKTVKEVKKTASNEPKTSKDVSTSKESKIKVKKLYDAETNGKKVGKTKAKKKA